MKNDQSNEIISPKSDSSTSSSNKDPAEDKKKKKKNKHKNVKSDDEEGGSKVPKKDDHLNVIQHKLGKDRFQVTVMDVKLDESLTSSYIRLTMGDHVVRTSISKSVSGEWNEMFSFEVAFHYQLFGVLQVDLYESRFLLPDLHIGRSEIKLSRMFGLNDEGFASWYELWDKEHSESNTSTVLRKSIVSKNVGAIRLRIKHNFTAYIDPSFFPMYKSTGSSISVTDTLHNLRLGIRNSNSSIEVSESSSGSSLGPVAVQTKTATSVPSQQILTPDTMQRTGSCPTVNQIEGQAQFSINTSPDLIGISAELNRSAKSFKRKCDEEIDMAASLEYFYHEDEEIVGRSPSILDKLGELLLSKETSDVLKSLRKLLAAFGQGLEMSNAALLSGILTLEKFYFNHGTKRTERRVTDLGKVQSAKHFYKFALAAYGWKGLNFFGKGKGVFNDATRLDADKKALLEYLMIPAEKLLHFSANTVDLFRPGYYIAVDELTDSIVLCVRGTMSTIDTLTDLVCEYTPWKGGLVHSGFKFTADWFMANVFEILIEYLKQHKKPNLILCGHSLGGATVTMLTMIIVDYLEKLRLDDGQKVTLHCYSYAPPPIASLNLAKAYRKYVDTFVAEDDIVCRLSYGHMMDMRSMIICALESEHKTTSIILELWKGVTGAPRTFSKGSLSTLNNLAMCQEQLRKNSFLENRNIKLFLVGTINFMYYEDPSKRPFSSLMPKYKDVAQSSSMVSLAISSKSSESDVSITEANQQLLAMEFKKKSTESVISPARSESSAKNAAVAEIIEQTKQMRFDNAEKKAHKRVIMETSTPEYFDEVIVKRTMFLEHIPNAYDKALDRTFETLMIDLCRSQSSENLVKPHTIQRRSSQ